MSMGNDNGNVNSKGKAQGSTPLESGLDYWLFSPVTLKPTGVHTTNIGGMTTLPCQQLALGRLS